MYHFILIAFQAVLFTPSEAEYKGLQPALHPTIDTGPSGLVETIYNVCHADDVMTRMEEYPYHALITGECFQTISDPPKPLDPPLYLHGFIISSNYILSYADELLGDVIRCDFYTVDILADRSKYETDIIRDGVLALFKLRDPIKEGSKAKKIEMIQAGEGPPSGSRAAHIGLFYEHQMDKFGVIPLGNGTITERQGLSEYYEIDPELKHDVDKYKDLVWLDCPGHICEDRAIDTFFLIDGRLGGFGIRLEQVSPSNGGKSKKGFINLARQRGAIQQLTGI